MARLSGGAALLLLVIIPLCMCTGGLLVVIHLGRTLERRPDSVSVSFSLGEAFGYVAKEIWDTGVFGRGGGRNSDLEESPGAGGQRSSNPQQPYILPPSVDDQGESSASVTPNNHGYHRNDTFQPRGVISVGPWGGSGEEHIYMRDKSTPRLHRIVLYHISEAISALVWEYSLAGEEAKRIKVAGPWKDPISDQIVGVGVYATIELSKGEHVTAMEGTTGRFLGSIVVTSLMFRTSAGRKYGPYGSGTAGTPFSILAASGNCIVGFWGYSWVFIHSIGVYIAPCPP
ncbi:unnamed protein product [Urochloa decumbens]|uniref:Jacalin-type lectin domain-containing protein n=1 Tax=Urochloa decumbens TaxID=240449 RepID=A0ABC9H3U8_9POAL